VRIRKPSEPDYVRMKPQYLRTDREHPRLDQINEKAIFLSGWLSMFGKTIVLLNRILPGQALSVLPPFVLAYGM
jgi:hypothetical protein